MFGRANPRTGGNGAAAVRPASRSRRRAVGLGDPVEPGALELAIDVRREHSDAMRKTLAPAAEDPEAGMRHGRPIEPESVTVEAPSQLRIGVEVARVGEIDAWERDTIYPKYGLLHGIEYTASFGVAEIGAYADFFGGLRRWVYARSRSGAGASHNDGHQRSDDRRGED